MTFAACSTTRQPTVASDGRRPSTAICTPGCRARARRAGVHVRCCDGLGAARSGTNRRMRHSLPSFEAANHILRPLPPGHPTRQIRKSRASLNLRSAPHGIYRTAPDLPVASTTPVVAQSACPPSYGHGDQGAYPMERPAQHGVKVRSGAWAATSAAAILLVQPLDVVAERIERLASAAPARTCARRSATVRKPRLVRPTQRQHRCAWPGPAVRPE